MRVHRRNANAIAWIIVAPMLAGVTPIRAASFNGIVLFTLTPPSGTSLQFTGAQISATQVVNSFLDADSHSHAVLWTTAGSIDLSPAGFTDSTAFGTNGAQQVGDGSGSATDNNTHALTWTGTPGSVVDLNPTNLVGFTTTVATFTTGLQQVGAGSGPATGGHAHALLWNNTADSAIDLNPANLTGFTDSGTKHTDGTQQVGYGAGSAIGNGPHALLWSGTADSAVDLNPTGINDSQANGNYGTQQVGIAKGNATGNKHHAYLWTGTAASAVDLEPVNLIGFDESAAVATNGNQQVGLGFGAVTDGNDHALLWSSTADSAVDLHPLLPASDTWLFSNAYNIDSSGNVFGFAQDVSGNSYAVEWSPVPEPAAISLLALSIAPLILRRSSARR